MVYCKHAPKIPFLVLLKMERYRENGEQVQFRCRKCGKIIAPTNKRLAAILAAKKFDFGLRFANLCIYIFCVQDYLLKMFQSIPGIPGLIVRLFVAISGVILSEFFLNILFFVFLCCIRWNVLNDESTD